MPYCQNKSPRRLCEEIEKVLPEGGGRIVRRPFNHYVPTMTDWWMVPSLELPFFKFGKYFFSWDENKREEIRCGLHLTKGLDPMLKKVYPSKKGRRLIMDESWGFHHFYPSVKSGEFGTLLRSVTADVGEIEIDFDGGYLDDPGIFDPATDVRKSDHYFIGCSAGAAEVRVKRAKRDAMCLKFFNKVRDLGTLETALGTLAEDSFMFCHIFISKSFSVKEYGEFETGDEVWTAEEIYRRWLAPFRKFVV